MKHVKVKRAEGCVILTPHGYLVGGEETDELQRLVQDLANEGNTCLVINLGETEFINSWALGVLIGAHVNYAKRGAHVRLCCAGERLRSLFAITKLSTVFEIAETEAKAIAGFQPA